MSVCEGLRALSTVIDMGLKGRTPLGCPGGNSKLNMPSGIAGGRNAVPCEHAVTSGPANSISQLIKISPNLFLK